MDEPNQPTEPTAEAKRSRGFASYVVWTFVLVMLYVLSSGPYWAFEGKPSIRPLALDKPLRIWGLVLKPVLWAYEETPLHKPLGIYWHFWCPELFDRNGQL